MKKLWNKRFMAALLAFALIMTSLATDGLYVSASEVRGITVNSEEATDEATAETTTEVAYPAAQFSQTMSDGTVISVDAPEGAFPEGTTMNATLISAESDMDKVVEAVNAAQEETEAVTAADILAYDISFYYNEEKIEPNCDINVTMENEAIAAADAELYHMDNLDAAAETVGEDLGQITDSEDGSISFASDEFSVYLYIKDNTRDWTKYSSEAYAYVYDKCSNGDSVDVTIDGVNYKKVAKADITFNMYYAEIKSYTIKGYEDRTFKCYQKRNAKILSVDKFTADTSDNIYTWNYDASSGKFVKLEAENQGATIHSYQEVYGDVYWILQEEKTVTIPTYSFYIDLGTDTSNWWPNNDSLENHILLTGTVTNADKLDSTVRENADLTLPDGVTVQLDAASQRKLALQYRIYTKDIEWTTYGNLKDLADYGNKYSEKTHFHINGKVKSNTLTIESGYAGGVTKKVTVQAFDGYRYEVKNPADYGIEAPEGKEFDYWYNANSGKKYNDYYNPTFIYVEQDTTFVATWRDPSIIVTFYSQGGKLDEGYAIRQAYAIGKAYGTLPTATKAGNYELEGWYTSRNVRVTENDIVTTNSSKTLDLYAHWKETGFDVTYIVNGTTVKTEDNVTKVTLPTADEKANYTLSWVDEKGNTVTDGQTVTANMTISAKYTPVPYSISYVLNDGEVNGNPTSYTIETPAITLANPQRAGYTFTGWSGTELDGEQNTQVTIPQGSTGNRTYTAHWEKRSLVITPSVSKVEAVYGPTTSYTVTGSTADDLNNAVSNVTYTYSYKDANGKEVTSTTAPSFRNVINTTLKITASATGYDSVTVNVPVVITRADNSISLDGKALSLTAAERLSNLIYGKASASYQVTVIDGEVKLLGADGKLTDTIETDSYTATLADGKLTITADKVAKEDISLTLKVAQTSNYNEVANEVLFTVENGTFTILAPTANVLTYDGSEQALLTALVLENTKEAITVTYALSKEKTEDASALTYNAAIPTAKAAGTYYVYYKADREGYHTYIPTEPVTIVIAPKPVTVDWTEDTTLVYDGSAQGVEATIVAEDIVEDDTVHVLYEEAATEAPTQTEAGAYTTTITGVDNANYALSQDAVTTCDWTIARAEATGYTGTYDGAAHGGTVTAYAEDAVITYGTVADTYNLTIAPTYTAVGTYTVYYQVEAEGYETLTGSYRIVINAVPVVIDDNTTPTTPTTPITPDAGNTPAGNAGAGNGGNAGNAGNANAVADNAEAVAIQDQQTPQAAAEETTSETEEAAIADDTTPLADATGTWALMDVILMVLAGLETLATILVCLKKKEKLLPCILSIIAAVSSVIIVCFTQDFAGKMIAADLWAIVLAIAFAADTAILCLMAKKDQTAEN